MFKQLIISIYDYGRCVSGIILKDGKKYPISYEEKDLIRKYVVTRYLPKVADKIEKWFNNYDQVIVCEDGQINIAKEYYKQVTQEERETFWEDR